MSIHQPIEPEYQPEPKLVIRCENCKNPVAYADSTLPGALAASLYTVFCWQCAENRWQENVADEIRKANVVEFKPKLAVDHGEHDPEVA